MRKLFGDRAFYRRVVYLILPIIIQNTVTNFVNLLDNLMVGRVGTEAMSGVAIANQLIFVFNLCIFGGLSGPGIFGAQFFGQENYEGVRSTFRFKLITMAAVAAAFISIAVPFGPKLISLFLTDGEGAGDLALTFEFGRRYLNIIVIGLIPFGFTQIYSGTLREGGKTRLPMIASIAAVFTNLCLNYILIYGKLGAPALGSDGAAIATVISRFAESGIIIIASHSNSREYPFLKGVYRTLRIPLPLVRSIVRRGSPLLLNEGMWSVGMAMLNQQYSLRGLAVIAALNISGTVTNLFNVVFMAMGNAIATMVGQELGSNRIKDARDTDNKLITLNFLSCVATGTVLFFAAPHIPDLYATTETVRHYATNFIRISACFMPVYSIAHSCYFTLRSGGKTLTTFIFDSGYTWIIALPLAFLLVHFTALHMIMIYICCESANIIKSGFGLYLVSRGKWARNIVGQSE